MCVFDLTSCIHNIAIFIFAASGVILVTLGALWSKSVSTYGEGIDQVVTSPVYILIAIGVLLLLLTVLGCCGSYNKSSCLLYTYSAILAVLFLAQLVLAILVIVKGTDLNDAVEKVLSKERDNCKPNSSEYDFFKTLQEGLSCCGVNGYYDWTRSACGELGNQCKEGYKNTGCAGALSDAITSASSVLGWVAIAIAALEVVGSIAGCVIGSKYRK